MTKKETTRRWLFGNRLTLDVSAVYIQPATIEYGQSLAHKPPYSNCQPEALKVCDPFLVVELQKNQKLAAKRVDKGSTAHPPRPARLLAWERQVPEVTALLGKGWSYV